MNPPSATGPSPTGPSMPSGPPTLGSPKPSPPPLTAAILSTGSELVLGQRIDTNSAWLSSFLSAMGVVVAAHESRGDDLDRLVSLIRQAWQEYDIVLMTGGLGPTEDDLTRLAVSRAFGTALIFRTDLAEGIRRLFERRGFPGSPNQMRQAWLPKNAALAPNDIGTAPAFAIEDEGRLMVMMPGVPQEMKSLTSGFVAEKLKEKFGERLGTVKTTTLIIGGLGEGMVDHSLRDLLSESVNPKLGLLAGQYETRVLVTSQGRDEAECARLETSVIAEVKRRLGSNFIGQGDEDTVTAASKIIMGGGIRIGFVDSATRGRTAKPFLEKIGQSALAGSMVANKPDAAKCLDMLFGELRANIVLEVSAVPKRIPPLGDHLDLLATIEIFELTTSGQRVSSKVEATVAGPSDLALERLAALAAFHLWRNLASQA